MRLRNFSPETQRSYIHYIAAFAKYFNLSPEDLGVESIREYQLHLIEDRKLSASSVDTFTAAAKFLYTITLEMPWSRNHFPRQKVPGSLPVVLSPTEVAIFFKHIGVIKFRAVLMTCYGAVLRISEAVHLKAGDIDSTRSRSNNSSRCAPSRPAAPPPLAVMSRDAATVPINASPTTPAACRTVACHFLSLSLCAAAGNRAVSAAKQGSPLQHPLRCQLQNTPHHRRRPQTPWG